MKTMLNRRSYPAPESFPCLMYYRPNPKEDDCIVVLLATGRGSSGAVEGTCLLSPRSYQIGQHALDWSSDFKTFDGSVTLSNN